MKLSHREPETVAREAELKAILAVGSGDLLGHGIEIETISFTSGSVVIEIGEFRAELSRADCEHFVTCMNAMRANQSTDQKSQPVRCETALIEPPRESACECGQRRPLT
jgi:hypothetical protein